jgi:DNA-binding GntR family transcriptional regulator
VAKSPALWQRTLRPVQHRIIWFLLDVGAPGMMLQHGWQLEAARQLEIHRITLRRQVQLLVEEGVLVEGQKKGTVMLNLRIFENRADRKNIRMMKAESAMVRR